MSWQAARSTTNVAGAGGAVSIARGGVTVDIAAHAGAGCTEGTSFRFGVFKSAHKKNAVLLGLETTHATP